MADPLCKFFDARSSQFIATYFTAQKSFLILPAVSLYNPTRRRSRRKSLHIACCSTPTSRNLDVISTHELSDGSLLFRFGDPSEVVKEDDKLEEPLLDFGVQEVERDNEEEFSVVKVFDGDNERQVIAKNVEREAKCQAVTVATASESVEADKEMNNVAEVETGLSENLVKDSANDIGSISTAETQDSVAEVNNGNAGYVEEILEKKDDYEASVSPLEDSFPFEKEIMSQSSKATLEELDDEKSPLLGSATTIPEYSYSVTTEEIAVAEGEISSQLTENGEDNDQDDDSVRLMENGAASTEVQAVDNDSKTIFAASTEVQTVDNASETIQQTERISENVDSITEESAESVCGEINLGNTENVDEISPEDDGIRNLSVGAEDQSTQVINIDSDDQTELNNLSADTEDQASQNGSLEDSGETNEVEVMPLSPKLEAEPILDEEVDHNIILESNEGESPLPPDEYSPNLSLEAERKEDVESNEITEVSGHEVVEDKSSEVIDRSKEATPAELLLSSGAILMEHRSKALTGGHEAYFVAGGKWLGVADGVGHWSLEGSDPGVYAKELMQNSESIVSQCDKDLINDPKQVLSLSISKTDTPGSSTALIAHFDGKALHVANIGDSGFIIVRHGSVYRKSSPMLYEFNFPIQIEKGDDPYQLLEEYKIELDEGDVIVTATDGLFDNLYEQEIVSIVSRSLESNRSLQEIAEILATRVLEVGSCACGRSPFADAAQAAGYVGYTGGKHDDVVVIVSVVQKVIMSNAN